jgi:hypothetical protein
MGTTAKLDTAHVELSPGTDAVLPLQIRNTGDVVEAYQLEVLGAPAAWTTVEPAVIEGLYPDTTATVTVHFSPPRSSSVPAGLLDFGVRVVPLEHADEVVVPEGVVEVLPFLDTTAELVPRTSHGRSGAKHQVALDNRGNVPVQVSLLAADDTGLLDHSVRPQILVVAPGHAEFAEVKVKPHDRLWRGADLTMPFTVTVAAENTTPVLLDGAHVQTATIPKWFLKALLALLLLLLLAVLLWFTLLKPTIESAAKSSVEDEVQQAEDAAAAAQEAVADPATASGGAKYAASDAAAAATNAEEAVEDIGDMTTGLLPPAENLSPTVHRMAVTPAPGDSATAQLVVPDKATFRITDLMLNNPQGDFGQLVVTADDVELFVLALENFRDTDYHFQTPLTIPGGGALVVTVSCRTPGAPLGQDPAPTKCDDALVVGGVMATPNKAAKTSTKE